MKISKMTKSWQFQKIGWPKFTKFLIITSAITIIIPWVVFALNIITLTGESGWGIFLLLPLWYAGLIFAAINIVMVIVYLSTHNASRKTVLLCIAAVILSAANLSVFYTLDSLKGL